ncbi:MAG: universal stress protein [Acidimicrobiales bacterium]
MHVLIGTDGSSDAVAAAVRAVELLALADTVTIVCIVETPALATAGLESAFAGGVARPEEIDAAWDAVHADAMVALDRTADAVKASVGPAVASTVETRIEMGAPGPDLCRLAGELSVDVVAVGSRGQGAIRRALLGSVSAHVVNNAPCAVMVIRPTSG